MNSDLPTVSTVGPLATLFLEMEKLGLPYIGFSESHCRDSLMRVRDGATSKLPALADSDMHSPWIGSPSRIGILNVPAATNGDDI